jgi:SAM-dependent methyltransferase
MIATLSSAKFATVAELFEYKRRGQPLKPFPGYSDDQWGIKAHNRPWIEATGTFRAGERIAEVGGAYSLLPEYLAERYGTESWIIDDFGAYSRETGLWQRWGDPDDWIKAHPTVHYVRKPMGFFAAEIPDNHFDCVFSVSTLEHVPEHLWSAVIKDMVRITKPGGRQLHSIDIPCYGNRRALAWYLLSRIPGASRLRQHPLTKWRRAFVDAGVAIPGRWPGVEYVWDRSLLIESPDVVFRCYPPTNQPKPFPAGGFSLLVQLEKRA